MDPWWCEVTPFPLSRFYRLRIEFRQGDTPEVFAESPNLKLLAEKSYQELLISGTFELEPPSSPAVYKRYVDSEIERWRPIVTKMGIKID